MITVRPFRMGTDKEAALKPLEESAEVFAEYQKLASILESDAPIEQQLVSNLTNGLADEIADVIQASCNLAARWNIDLRSAMERCRKRNIERGRYGERILEEIDGLRPYVTAKSVLKEFAELCHDCCDTPESIAEYAKRLRLAEEDE